MDLTIQSVWPVASGQSCTKPRSWPRPILSSKPCSLAQAERWVGYSAPPSTTCVLCCPAGGAATDCWATSSWPGRLAARLDCPPAGLHEEGHRARRQGGAQAVHEAGCVPTTRQRLSVLLATTNITWVADPAGLETIHGHGVWAGWSLRPGASLWRSRR